MGVTYICPDETPPGNWLTLCGEPKPYKDAFDIEFVAEIYGEFSNVNDFNSFTGKVFFVNKGTLIEDYNYSALPNVVMFRTMLINLNDSGIEFFVEECFVQCLADASLNGIIPYPNQLSFLFPA